MGQYPSIESTYTSCVLGPYYHVPIGEMISQYGLQMNNLHEMVTCHKCRFTVDQNSVYLLQKTLFDNTHNECKVLFEFAADDITTTTVASGTLKAGWDGEKPSAGAEASYSETVVIKKGDLIIKMTWIDWPMNPKAYCNKCLVQDESLYPRAEALMYHIEAKKCRFMIPQYNKVVKPRPIPGHDI